MTVWVGPVGIPVNLNSIQIGLGGALTGFPLAVDAAPWTLETGSVAFLTTTTYMTLSMGTSITVTNMFTTTVTQMGTTSPAGSRMTLVTPTYVLVPGNLLPVTSKLEIHFVPEPGRFVLLVAGLAGFAAAARRRV